MRSFSFFALAAAVGLTFGTAQAEGYQFKIHNKTSVKIVSLLVSEDGTKWDPFNLGEGVGAGQVATMVWGEAAEGRLCEQQVKAVYSDKSESEPTSFDFCEAGLELDFEE